MGPPFIWCQKEDPPLQTHRDQHSPHQRSQGIPQLPSKDSLTSTSLAKACSLSSAWEKAALSWRVQPLESANLVQILGSPLTSSGSLSNSLNFPEPQFLHLYNGNTVSLLNLHMWNPEIRRADCTTHFYIRDLNIFGFSVSAGGPGTSLPGIPRDDCTQTYFLGSWWRLNEIIQVRHWAHVQWRVTLAILRRYQIFHLKGLLGNV